MELVKFPEHRSAKPSKEGESNTVKLWELVVDLRKDVAMLKEARRRDRKTINLLLRLLKQKGIL